MALGADHVDPGVVPVGDPPYVITVGSTTGPGATAVVDGPEQNCPVVRGSDGSCDLVRWRAGRNGAMFSPQGGLRISARDLSKIGRLLLGEGVVDGVRLLRPTSFRTLTNPEWVFDGHNGLIIIP